MTTRVKVLAARFSVGGVVYTRGQVMDLNDKPNTWAKGIHKGLETENLVILPPEGEVEVDMSAVNSDPLWCDPKTTDVTGDDLVLEAPTHSAESVVDQLIGQEIEKAKAPTSKRSKKQA